MDDDEYMRFLADGGFMVEFMAKARFPGARDLAGTRDPAEAFAQTMALIAGRDGAVIFEAAAIWGKYHARFDIVKREGNVLRLIEVKSSSLGEENGDREVDLGESESPFFTKRGDRAIRSEWREYIWDIAFQAHVMGKAFPQFTIEPELCVVDKRSRVTDAETLDRFSLEKDPLRPRGRPVVHYKCDASALAKSRLLRFCPVREEVAFVMPEVVERAQILADLINVNGSVRRVGENLETHYKLCRECEYRTDGAISNGFRECWGILADAAPHILDLHRVGQIGSASVPDPVPGLLRDGRARLTELGEDQLGREGPYQERRLLQWQSMRDGGREYLPEELVQELRSHQSEPGWPLHFLDFEACNVVLPHHAGLRPYERIAFQWSCHTVHEDGGITHAEWLNTERELPNFAFARTLRERLGERGTIYVWSPYEASTLNCVLRQIDEWVERDAAEAVRLSGLPDRKALEDLAGWIDLLLGHEDKDGARHDSPRIRDLHKLALKYYFHPRMGGRTSIKVVLPSIWERNRRLWEHPEFRQYFQLDGKGVPKDPYKVLPALPLGGDAAGVNEDAVREGTGAIRVYQDLIFASDRTAADSENRRKLLLQYCKLDTAAMVMIWMHWVEDDAG